MSLPFRLREPSVSGRYIPINKKTELAIQQRVCSYLRKHYPDVLFHSDYGSGLRLTEHQSMVNKSLQSGNGFPDLTIYHQGRDEVKNGVKTGRKYVGLALELKADGVTVIVKTGQNKGRLTSNPHIRRQAIVLRSLIDEGWFANFAVGYDEAIKIISWYFEEPVNLLMF